MTDYSSTIKTGDRVAYGRLFLQSIGDYSHERASRRGTVARTALIGHAVFCTVHWDGIRTAATISRGNLWPADKIHLEPA